MTDEANFFKMASGTVKNRVSLLHELACPGTYNRLGRASTASEEESPTLVLHRRPQRDSECEDKGGLFSTITYLSVQKTWKKVVLQRLLKESKLL